MPKAGDSISPMKKDSLFLIFIFCLIMHVLTPPQARTAVEEHSLRETIDTLSSFGSRATGSPGYEKAAAFLEEKLESLGLQPQSYFYELPVRRSEGAELSFDNRKISLTPFTNNAITPEATDGTITAPLFYVGKGRLEDLDGKDIKGSIALLDGVSTPDWKTYVTANGSCKRNDPGKFNLELLQSLTFPLADDEKKEVFIGEAIKTSLEHAVDQVSRELMQLRLQEQTDEIKQSIKHLARQRLLYRRLGWAESYNDLPEGEAELFRQIVPKAIDRNERIIDDTGRQLNALQSATTFRNHVRDYEVAAIVSLHLSSHGNGVGAFHRGWLYDLKQTINRTSFYRPIAEVLEKLGEPSIGRAQYQDTLRPSHLRTWDSWFFSTDLTWAARSVPWPATSASAWSLRGMAGYYGERPQIRQSI